MPSGQAWTEPQPHLVSAAIALSAGRPESCAAALDAADGILERFPADQETTCRLAAALIRLAASLRTGDLVAAASAAARAELLVSRIPSRKLARHPDIKARVLSGRGAVELWSGHLDEAARVLEAGVAAAASGGEYETSRLPRASGAGGGFARSAEPRGTGWPAGGPGGRTSSGRPTGNPNPAALVALAWVHLQRNELREARSRLKQADAALGASPDRLIATVAYLVTAGGALAEGRARWPRRSSPGRVPDGPFRHGSTNN